MIMSQNRKVYCRHCQEVIIHKGGKWHGLMALKSDGLWGKSYVCKRIVEGFFLHEPR